MNQEGVYNRPCVCRREGRKGVVGRLRNRELDIHREQGMHRRSIRVMHYFTGVFGGWSSLPPTPAPIPLIRIQALQLIFL